MDYRTLFKHFPIDCHLSCIKYLTHRVLNTYIFKYLPDYFLKKYS